MPAFPHHLCTILQAGNERPTPVVLRSEVERGIARQRRSAADSLVQVSLQLGFETAQASADFDAWFFGEALAGAAWFDFTNPRTNTVVQARVVGGDVGALSPLAEAYRVAERSLVLEYVRPGFRTLPPGLHSVTPAQVLQVQRASTATFVDAGGVLQTAAAHVPRFTYFSGKNIYSGPVDLVAGPGVGLLDFNLKTLTENPANLQPGEALTASFDLYQDGASASVVGRSARFLFQSLNSVGTGTGAIDITSVRVATSGRISVTLTLPALLADIARVRVVVQKLGGAETTSGTVRADSIMIERGSVATAYEPGARLLVEGSATNLVLQSENMLSSPWGNRAGRVASTIVASGSSPRTRFTVTANGSLGGVRQVIPGLVSGAQYVWSFYAQGAVPIEVLTENGAVAYGTILNASLNPATGVLTFSGPVFTYTSVASGAGWRVSIVFPPAAGSLLANLELGVATTGQTFVTGEHQFTQGAARSSYIPTTTAPATRAADVIQVAA